MRFEPWCVQCWPLVRSVHTWAAGWSVDIDTSWGGCWKGGRFTSSVWLPLERVHTLISHSSSMVTRCWL
jgi:hypothetical protein